MFEHVFVGCTEPADERLFREILRDCEAVDDAARFEFFVDCGSIEKRVDRALPDLVVVDFNLPQGPKDAAVADGCGGLELVERLTARGVLVSAILIGYGEPDGELRVRLVKLAYCRLLDMTRTPAADVPPLLEAMLDALWRTQNGRDPGMRAADPETAAAEPVGWIEIDLSDELKPFAHCYLPDPVPTPDVEFLSIEARLLDDLMQRSRALAKRLNQQNYDDWLLTFNSIGWHMYRMIFHSQLDERLRTILACCNNKRENVRIRFSVPPARASGLFEALVPTTDDEHFMVRAPIARRVRLGSERDEGSPRGIGLADTDALNVLVIDASATRFQPVIGGVHTNQKLADWLETQQRRLQQLPKFPPLAFAAEEVAMFYRLRESVERGRPWRYDEARGHEAAVRAAIGRVEILASADDDTAAAFWGRVERTLAADADTAWHLVHFIGHSFCVDPNDLEQSSFLVFPGRDGNAAIPATEAFQELSKASTRFAYFSSCESASSDVAVAASRNGLPAALGFRWRLPDATAPEFAREVYKSLVCDGECLDEAVRDARRAVHNRFDRYNDPTWASAVLICQSRGWHRGYGDRVAAKPVAAA